MDKLIEMTLDGRLSIIWTALLCFVVIGVWEWLAGRQKVSDRRNSRK